MDFYGNINLKDNEMQQLVFEQETSFPVDAVAGSIVFKDNALYMCVALNVADPIWIPLTATIDTYIHEQSATATTWTITHNLGEENVILQVYDDSNQMIIPDTVTPTDTNEIVMTFNIATAGRAIIMFGDEIPANGIGIIDPQSGWIINDISQSTATGISYITGLINPVTSVLYNNDGTKMYASTSADDIVNQHTLGTPYDLSTASNDNVSFSFNAQEGHVNGISFNNDGTKMYAVGQFTLTVYQYSMTVAYDISTMSYDSIFLSLGSNFQLPRHVSFSEDGLILYLIGSYHDGAWNPGVAQYALSVGFDLTTATFSSRTAIDFDVSDVPNSGVMSPDGTKLYVVYNSGNVLQFSVGTAYDTSTVVYDNLFFDRVISGPLEGFAVSSDGTSFLSATNSTVYQYSTNI